MEFYKYQGAGNDFVMIDNRELIFEGDDRHLVAKLCNRRFGIGADGLILLEKSSDETIDFKMVYFNSDGRESSMCGNGGRCIVAFAKKLGIIKDNTTFEATDGIHQATIDAAGIVSLQMIDVHEIKVEPTYVFMDTGSPHHIEIVEDIENCDVKEKGASIRYGCLYGKKGSNVNFVNQTASNEFSLRTYERGVEDETLACGTGATATAIAMNAMGKTTATNIILNVKGGKLEVSFDEIDGKYTNVFLKGAAEFVFWGNI